MIRNCLPHLETYRVAVIFSGYSMNNDIMRGWFKDRMDLVLRRYIRMILCNFTVSNTRTAKNPNRTEKS
jgi:hypothetical protein